MIICRKSGRKKKETMIIIKYFTSPVTKVLRQESNIVTLLWLIRRWFWVWGEKVNPAAVLFCLSWNMLPRFVPHAIVTFPIDQPKMLCYCVIGWFLDTSLRGVKTIYQQINHNLSGVVQVLSQMSASSWKQSNNFAETKGCHNESIHSNKHADDNEPIHQFLCFYIFMVVNGITL